MKLTFDEKRIIFFFSIIELYTPYYNRHIIVYSSRALIYTEYQVYSLYIYKYLSCAASVPDKMVLLAVFYLVAFLFLSVLVRT